MDQLTSCDHQSELSAISGTPDSIVPWLRAMVVCDKYVITSVGLDP